MSVINKGDNLTFKAGADLTGKKGYLVKMSADDTVVLAAAATDEIIGALVTEAKQGDVVSVANPTQGTFKVIAGGSISRGNRITSDSAGKGIAATQAIAGAQPTTRVVGSSIQGSVSTNDLFEVRGGPDVI